MKRKILSVLGLFAATVMLLVSSSVAHAAPNTNRGIHLDGTDYDGLRAIVSTMVGTGSPPAFYFPAKSPDVLQMYTTQVHPRNSCFSASVWQVHQANSGTTSHTLQVSSFCGVGAQSGNTTYDLTDATFRSKYVRTLSYNDTGVAFQDEVIDIRVVLTNAPTNRWSLYIYNFNTSTYDWLYWKEGTSGQVSGYVRIGDGGYTQDPTMSCPTLYPWGIMQARGIQKRVAGVWSLIGSGDITGTIADSWPCITTNNYKQTSPYPYQLKILPYGAGY
jgi:hypothetical protein